MMKKLPALPFTRTGFSKDSVNELSVLIPHTTNNLPLPLLLFFIDNENIRKGKSTIMSVLRGPNTMKHFCPDGCEEVIYSPFIAVPNEREDQHK
jgi:hypothetical protein